MIARILLLAVAAFALYGLAPQMLDMWGTVPRLRTVSILWFTVMITLESGSYVCAWALTRVALPQVPWFVAGTAQLVSNAVALSLIHISEPTRPY